MNSLKPLFLNDTTLSSSKLAAFLKEYLDIDSLRINSPSQIQDGDKYILTGTTHLFNIQDLPIEAVHSSIDGFQFQLVAKMPSAWSIKDSFPDMPEYYDFSEALFLKGPQPSFFHQLSLSKSYVILSTHTFFDKNLGLAIQEGLHLYSDAGVTGPFHVLNLFGNIPQAIPVSGPITLKGKSPKLLLYTGLPTSLKIGPFKLEHLQLGLFSSLDKKNPKTQTGMQFKANIAIGDIQMDIYTNALVGSKYFEFQGQFENLPLPDPGQLMDLVGVNDLNKLLPPGIVPAFMINSFELDIDFKDLHVHRLAFELGLSKPWEVMGGALKMEDLALMWKVDEPFDQKKRHIVSGLSGTFLMDSVPIYWSASLPGLDLYGEMDDDEFLPLQHIIETFLPKDIAIPSQLTDLYIDEMGFQASLASKYLNFYGEIYGTLEVLPGMSMSRMAFDFNFGSDIPSGAEGWIDGIFNIAGVNIVVECSFPNDFSFKGAVEGNSLNLTQILEDLLLSSFDLPEGIPELIFDRLAIEINTSEGSFLFEAQSSDIWDIAPGYQLNNIHLEVEAHKDLGFSALIRGQALIGNKVLNLQTNISKELEFSVSLSRISLNELAEQFLDNIELPAQLPDLSFRDVELALSSKTGKYRLKGYATKKWSIPLGVADLHIVDVSIDIERASKKGKSSGSLEGALRLGGNSFDLRYNMGEGFVLKSQLPKVDLGDIIEDLCGKGAFQGLPMPTSFLDLELTDVELEVAPQAKYISIQGMCQFGITELRVKKNKKGKWGFVVAFAPQKTFQFSSIDPSLKVLNDLDISNSGLILATETDRIQELEILPVPDQGFTVSRGLNFFTSLKTKGLGVDELMNIHSLEVSAAIGNQPSRMMLEAAMEGSFRIAKGVEFGDMRFRLQPAPSQFSVGVHGAITAAMDENPLLFKGGLELNLLQRTLSFQAMMLGDWVEPFGFANFKLSDLAIDLGMAFAPPVPVIGIAGSMKIGNVEGSAAVGFNAAMPTQSMLAVNFNRLGLGDILQNLCDPTVYEGIPEDFRNTVLSAALEEVDLHIVPQATQIADLFYDQGISFKGKLKIADFDARAHISLGILSGILIDAQIDPINMGGMFELSGADPHTPARLFLEINPMKTPRLEVSGAVTLLGVTALTDISISDSEFYFLIAGNIFNLFEASIEAWAEDFKNGGDLYLKVKMGTQFTDALLEGIPQAIQEVALEASKGLGEAQEAVEAAQKEVERLDMQIEAKRGIVRKEREHDQKKLAAAQADVKKVKDKVKGIDGDISRLRIKIEKARAADQKKREAARKKLTAAQGKVNSLKKQINRVHAKIAALKTAIRNKNNWANRQPRRKRWGAKIKAKAYQTANLAKITTEASKIAGLTAAKASAVSVMEVAKKAVQALDALAVGFPVDMDPRITALHATRETVVATLHIAETTVKGLEVLSKVFPIDADPRIAVLITARQSAWLSLEVSEKSLGLLKKGADLTAYAAGELADLDIEIKEVGFEGNLSAVNGGGVSLSAKVKFQGKEKFYQFSYNFHNPFQGVKNLAQDLLFD